MGTIADKLNYTQTSVSSIRNAIKQKNDAYVIDGPLADAAQAILDISGGGSGGGYDVKSGVIDKWNNNLFYLPRKEMPISVTFYKTDSSRTCVFDKKISETQYLVYSGSMNNLLSPTSSATRGIGWDDENGMFYKLPASEQTNTYYIAIFENKESRIVKFAKAIGVPAVATFDFDVKAVLIGRVSASTDRFNPYRSSAIEWMAYKADDGSTHSVVAGSYYELAEEPTTSGIYIDGNTVTAKNNTSQNSLFICAFNYVPDEIKNAIDG